MEWDLFSWWFMKKRLNNDKRMSHVYINFIYCDHDKKLLMWINVVATAEAAVFVHGDFTQNFFKGASARKIKNGSFLCLKENFFVVTIFYFLRTKLNKFNKSDLKFQKAFRIKTFLNFKKLLNF